MIKNHFVEITTNNNMKITMIFMIQQQNFFYCFNEKHDKNNEKYCKNCIEQTKDNKIHVNDN